MLYRLTVDKNVRKFSVIEIIGLICLALAIFASILIYIFTLIDLPFAKVPEDFGTFGDYVGGIIGTLVGLIGIIFLYRTYRIQLDISAQQELKQESQQFETAFFALLGQQRDILQNISGEFINNQGDRHIEVGAKFINTIRMDLAIRLLELSYEPEVLEKEKINILKVRVNSIYLDLYKNHVEQLGHYFRHLYHLIKFIDSHCSSNPQSYVDIVQAQMTTDELYLSAINGISQFGRKKFLPLLEKYHFFENLMIEESDVGNDLIDIFYPTTKRKNIIMQNQNIIFIGGIHAVGKSTFIKYAKEFAPNIEVLSCSALLNWEKPVDKEVEDVRTNQERLLSALNVVVDVDKPYFVDGHFCLLDSNHNIVPIDFDIIKAINPRTILLLTEDVKIVHQRLLERDGKNYDMQLLLDMDSKERELAQTFSTQYDVPIYVINSDEYSTTNEIISRFSKDYEN